MSELLSKKTYRAVIRGIERLKADNLKDRQENPSAIAIGWSSSIRHLVEHCLRENHERCPKDLPDRVITYLLQKGILINYLGDVSFPNTVLPSEAGIRERTNKILKGLSP